MVVWVSWVSASANTSKERGRNRVREKNLKVRAILGGGSRWLCGGAGNLGFVEGSVREELMSHCDREKERGFLKRDGLYEKKGRGVEIENKVRFGFDGKVRGENIDGW